MCARRAQEQAREDESNRAGSVAFMKHAQQVADSQQHEEDHAPKEKIKTVLLAPEEIDAHFSHSSLLEEVLELVADGLAASGFKEGAVQEL